MNRHYAPASVQQAHDWVDQWPVASGSVELALHQAAGYLLTQSIKAATDIPLQAQCARDGYAVIAADTLGAGDYNPLVLRLTAADKTLGRGQAIQVSAGDPLPEGADAILSLSQAEPRHVMLDVSCSLAAGEGVLGQGEECQQSDILLAAGRRLRPQDLARLAFAGVKSVKVRRKPRVVLLLAGHFIHDADGTMLSPLIARDGGELIGIQSATSRQTLDRQLTELDADVILVAGGSGYGHNDFAVQALHDCGEIGLDGVTIHPGGGVVMGRVTDKPVLLLPGSPLSCLCAYDLIAARLLRRMAAKSDPLPYCMQTFTLSRKLVSRIGQLELARMRIEGQFAEPLAVADDRLLSSSVRADGFTLLAENSEGYAEGSEVEVYLYDEYNQS
jgi:molybdopterin molybdotransferase